MPWTPDSIKSTLAGAFLARPSPARQPSDDVIIDSRAATPNCIFFALKGDRTDGHLYLKQASENGAAVLIIHDSAALNPKHLPADVTVIQVQDTGQALMKLAAAHRKTLETTKVIAIGGSNGKTTVCKLLHSVLSRTLRGTASPKSFNNAVGVPLTILAAKRTDQYLICEVGANAPGEISPLAQIVQPDIAVITSIGREHLEGFASLKGVIAEEAKLVGPLRPGGAAIINADAPELLEVVRPIITSNASKADAPRSLITFGHAGTADLRLTNITPDPDGTTFTINDRETFRVPLTGAHNAANAAAVIAVARRLGLTRAEIETGLANAIGPEMRMQRTAIADVIFINDAYNANPESALAAVKTFAEVFIKVEGIKRRVMVLGDMLELGDQGPDLHRELGDAVVECEAFDLVILVGPLSMFAGERIAKAFPAEAVVPFFDAGPANAAAIAALFKPGDLVLLKASRGTGLEHIITALSAARK